MSDARVQTMEQGDPRDRNRVVVRVLLMIMAALMVASFLVGIRW